MLKEQNENLNNSWERYKLEKDDLQNKLNDLSKKYDESLRDWMGLRSEIKHLDKEK